MATFNSIAQYLKQNIRVEAKSSNYTVLTTESGKIFTNEGATSQVEFTLPSAEAEVSYTFIVQDSDGIRINAASGDTIRLGNSAVSSSGGYIESTDLSASLTLICLNTTEWIVLGGFNGSWTTN